ncbi:hypothetical protein [Agrilutibacter solisilvae]|uniref:Uncharacterized protein n=1 Tax=Agrilutibacter solisilvae TaxID=2763317 RepID=A0A975AS46_9GAMM|nr:hypothetical protein [Lysobacter solisilvae]QSX77694.1 hypothetical protein I8J32_013225 [Lysobacter solisilvae]
MAAQARPGQTPAVPRPVRAAPDETLSNAIAGPLVVALAEQFGGRRVDMRLTTAEVEPMETGVSAVRGTGQVQVGGRGEWIGFNYELGYDSRLRRAAFPDVSIGGAASGERDMPNDVALVEQLEGHRSPPPWRMTCGSHRPGCDWTGSRQWRAAAGSCASMPTAWLISAARGAGCP